LATSTIRLREAAALISEALGSALWAGEPDLDRLEHVYQTSSSTGGDDMKSGGSIANQIAGDLAGVTA
jgi:hypothetical protein